MRLMSGAAAAPRILTLCGLYVLVLSCGEQSDSVGAEGRVRGTVQALSHSGIAGVGGQPNPGGSGGSQCVRRASTDSLPDGVDEDCDGRVDEECDYRPSDCPRGYRVIEGTSGNDVLQGTSGADCIYGYGGDDVIQGSSGGDILYGGPGDDRITSGNGKDTLYGGPGDDTIDCANGKDVAAYGGAGHDVIYGGNGKDTLYGGDGNDHLLGGNGKDALYGEGCNDWLEGGNGKNDLVGGAGHDLCDDASPGCEVLPATKRSCNSASDCQTGQVCADQVKYCVPAGAGACNSCTPSASDDVSCDGVDDDCDSRVDENFSPTTTHCGIGGCAAQGTTSCVDKVLQDSCVPGVPAASDVLCNGVDEDCDARIDENFPSSSTQCGVGECMSSGATSCQAGTVVDSCVAKPAAGSDATCDGLDQDCDGQNDESFVPTVTQCGLGACLNHGQWTCTAAGLHDTCQPLPAAAADSACDDVDQDCDGRNDEDFAAYPITCGRGVCERQLQARCISGHVEECPARPSCEDACEDGLDNDFDGLTDCKDSDCAGQAACLIGHGCTADVDCGAGSTCERSIPGGYCTRACDAEQLCPQGSVCLPHARICALPCKQDQTCEDAALSCQTFTTAGAEDQLCRPTCAAASCGAGTFCDPRSNLCSTCEAQDASCDGVDQDCDGTSDDDYTSAPTQCGLGACASTGVRQCVQGQEHDTCAPGAAGSDANCNGIDEDCDGIADDAYATVVTQCGSGGCAATGQIACVAGQLLPDTCVPSCENACTDAHDGDRDGEIDCQDSDCSADPACSIKLGDGCGSDFDCLGLGASPSCIRELPGGYCTSSCSSDSDCQAPGICAAGRCWLACSPDRSCADPQQVCSDFGPDQLAVCHQGCSAGCAAGTYCDPIGQLCQACRSSDTTCDGTDDDCDGQIDDDVPSSSTTCGGTGLCASSGTLSCVAGRMQNSCVPRDLGDGNSCTNDVCNPATGAITHQPLAAGADCSDGNVCNGTEACQLTQTPVVSFRQLHPRAAYIRTDADDALNATAYALASFGIQPGDRIIVIRQGSHSLSGSSTMGAVFSSSATLLASTNQQRVPGALATGLPAFPTVNTYMSTLPTDIAQDFFVPLTGVEVTVPAGATHLFIGAIDAWYADNTDTDGDYGFRIDRPGAACVVIQPAPIDDGNPCTLDLCSAQTGISHSPASPGSACSDSNACTVDSCDGAGACKGTPIDLSDNDPCTIDTCVPSTGPQHTPAPEGTSCSDNDVCNGLEACRTVPSTQYREQINPRGAFIDVNSQYPRVLPLANYGLKAGDRISMRASGSFAGFSSGNQMNAVFSSDTTLLPVGTLQRVPGALQSDAPPFVISGVDIPQDFRVTQTALQVTIPAGAQYLFVGVHDTANFLENYDSDGDFALLFSLANPPKFGCQPGIPLSVDDGNACTADACDAAIGVTHAPSPMGAATCASLGHECGSPSDGCGGTLNCGACPEGQQCGTLAAGRCGPPALLSPPQIHVSRRINAALYENGARLLEPANAERVIRGLGEDYTVPNTAAAKLFTVDLIGDLPHVIQQVSFTWISGHGDNKGADHAEIWVSDQAPFDAAKLVRVADQTIKPDVLQTLTFAPTRARFMRLVITRRDTTGTVNGSIRALQAFTRDREGGLVSLTDGEASIVAASNEYYDGQSTLRGAYNAFDSSDSTFWQTASANPQWVIVKLDPGGFPVDQLELRSNDFFGIVGGFKELVLELSNTGLNDTDFSQVLTAPGQRTVNGLLVFDFAPTPAKYARLRMQGNTGTTWFVIQRARIYSQAVGGAVVPFEDLTGVPDSNVASRLWTFGDGSTSTEAHPLHTYEAAGTYEITLTVTDTTGRQGFTRSQYTVLAGPTPDFDWTPAVVEETHDFFRNTTLRNRSVPAPGTHLVAQFWSSPGAIFWACSSSGCGPSPNGINGGPTQDLLYQQHGTYTMTLRVTDSRLISSTVSKQIQAINIAPTVKAGDDASTLWGDAIGLGFGELSVADQGAVDSPLLRCVWDFGDGTTQAIELCRDKDKFVGHTYAEPGVYTATLTAFDDVSSGSDSLRVDVGRRPTTVVPVSMEPTEEDGVFELSARLYDSLDDSRLITQAAVEFHYEGGVITALTDSTSTARARVRFAPLGLGTVEYAFAGNARYLGTSDSLDVLVRQGDTAPQPITERPAASEGSHFVLAFPQNGDYLNYAAWTKQLWLMISSRTNTTATVRIPALDFERTVGVSSTTATAVPLPEAARMGKGDGRFNVGDSGIIENKGIEVTSPLAISVQVFDELIHSTDGYLALPVDRLGSDYLVLGMHNEKQRSYETPSGSRIAFVAVEPDTHVQITPTADIAAGPQLPNGARRGETFEITLDALQTFQAHAPSNTPERFEDLTGTRIVSDKPIAVYGGHACTTLSGGGTGACNHVVEQMPAIDNLGRHFLSVPMQIKKNGQRMPHGDFLRVLAAYADTEVRIDGQLVATLDRGETYNTRIGYLGYHEITTSQPSLVGQYMRGANTREPSDGDPSFMLLPPSTQYIDRAVVSTLPAIGKTVKNPTGYVMTGFVSVVAKTREVGSIRLDGQPLTAAWRTIGDGSYAGARVSIGHGSHVLNAAKPGVRFMAFTYGYAPYDSYSLPLGLEFTRNGCQPTRTQPGDSVDNDCDGVEGEERANGLDDDGDGVKDEDLAVERDPNAPNRAPTVASTVYDEFSGSMSFAIPGYDQDGDTLSYRIVSAPPSAVGTTTLSADRITFTGTISSSAEIVVVANDGRADSAPGKLTLRPVTNSPCNDPLQFTTNRCNEVPYTWGGDFGSQVIKVPSGQLIQFSSRLNGVDQDLQPVRYKLLSGPNGLQINETTGLVTWLIDSNMLGTYNVNYRLSDPFSGFTDATAQLIVVSGQTNTAPVIDSAPVALVQADHEYSYTIQAHDAENQALTYTLVAGPSAMRMTGATVSWLPTTNDAGEHAVMIRVTDSLGGSAVQTWSLSVSGSPLQFISTPNLTAAVGTEYVYLPEVLRAIGPGNLEYGLGAHAPAGMLINQGTGKLVWTPENHQLGTHEVELIVRDEEGNEGAQFFSIEVTELDAKPRILSTAVTQAVANALYVYDVDGADVGQREVLTYHLTQAPAGMGIDSVTGRIEWRPTALGSYAVKVEVSDSHGQTHAQTFVVEVIADTLAPELDVQFSSQIVDPGQSISLTALADDEVGVTSLLVTVDGVVVQLDADGNVQWSSMNPGAHTLVVTAVDASGNRVEKQWTLGVRDELDTVAPLVSITSPTEDAQLTYIHDILGSVNDVGLLDYTLELRRVGDLGYRKIGSGTTSVSGKLGTLDTTQLENGYYELRLSARDVNELSKSTMVLVRVDGQAKPGLVQLSFVDAVVPMAGIPLSVRSYDSRVKTREDFGYGWRLSLKHGVVQHNRPVGEGIAIYTAKQDFALPCQGVLEQKSHFTEVRLSEREHYIFRPVVANTEGVAGGCEADIGFELVEGSTAGAELFILGNVSETRVRASALPIVEDPNRLPHSVLTYALEPDRGVFNPSAVRLVLRDGRSFDLDLEQGITQIHDVDGNTLQFDSDGVHHNGGKSLFFVRDAQGRVTRVTDPMGHVVQYGYDLSGDLAYVDNAIGERTRFTYRSDIPHHLQYVYDATGTRVAAMDYDAAGRLKRTCDAEGACSRSDYDLPQRVVVQTDATARPMKYTYDVRGNVTAQTDGLGHTTRFAYDGFDNLIRAEGPDGSVATYTYDGSHNMLSRVLPHEEDEPAADFTYRYEYTPRNQRKKVTVPTGASLHFDYDAEGHPTATRDDAGNVVESATYNTDGTLASRTNRFGTTRYELYQAGQPTQIIDPFGVPSTLSYDAKGRLSSRSERGLTSTFRYDALGRRTKNDYGNGAAVNFAYMHGVADWTSIEGPTFGTVTRSFTSSGRLGAWTEPNGDTFARLYDGGGRVKEEIDALGNRTAYGYDAAGRLQAISDVTLNSTTLLERDAAGRVTKTTDALGHETTTAYKLGGRLESTMNARGKTTSFDRNPLSASITDALNRTTVTSLSTYGLPLGTQYPGGSDTASSYLGTTRLDGSQQFPTSFEDEVNRSRDYDYDAKSGLTSATDLAGQQWQYQYAAAAASGVSYDVFSGNVSAGQQDGGASAYQSSGGGTEYRDVATTGGSDGGNFSHMLSQVTSPMGEVTKFERGTNGRINKVTYPDGGTRTIAYDAANRPQTITLPQGTVVNLGHDGLGRETSRTTSTGEFRYLTYGVGDRIETMTDNTGTTDYEYDSAGRFSGIVYPHGGSVRYTRDKLDRTKDVKVKPTASAAEIVTHYEYDENGNLAEITDPLGGVTGFAYDEADRLEQRVLPNGVVTSYSYDSRDRVLSVVHKNASNVVLASVTYVRSPSGELTRITREDGTYTTVEYDAALRISKESEFDANAVLVAETSYGYDLDGNRTSKTTLTGNETYSYSAGFKLDSITTSTGNEQYTHDGGERLIRIDRDGATKTLTYDSMDHITRVQGGGVDESYEFDGMGRRVGIMTAGFGSRKLLVAPNLGDGYESPQAVVDDSGSLVATFVYAGEHPIAKITPSGVEYLLADSMGSVIGKSNAAGASTATIKYGAFGDVIGGVNTGIDAAVGFEHRLHGMSLDAATGLYFVRARSYDAATGRFVSRDPFSGWVRQPESMNPFAFCLGDPHVWRDPSGAITMMELIVVAAVVTVLTAVHIKASVAAEKRQSLGVAKDLSHDVRQNVAYHDRVWGAFKDTNTAVPGLVAPSGLGLATGASGAEAAGWGGITATQFTSHALQRWKVHQSPERLRALVPYLRTVIQTHARSFVRVGFAFEAGVLAGAVVGSVPIDSEEGTIGNFIGAALYDQYYWDREFIPVQNAQSP